MYCIIISNKSVTTVLNIHIGVPAGMPVHLPAFCNWVP